MKAPFFITLLLLIQPAMVYADAEINFSGTLVEEPCTLAPEDSAIEIDFGTVISKMLYSHKRTPGKPFTLHLLDCDLSLGDTVSVTFTGNEDPEQPGFIQLGIESGAAGVAIGIESLDNVQLPINKPSPATKLQVGENELFFQLFISASENAIINKEIASGIISSVVHTTLSYE